MEVFNWLTLVSLRDRAVGWRHLRVFLVNLLMGQALPNPRRIMQPRPWKVVDAGEHLQYSNTRNHVECHTFQANFFTS